MILLFFIQVFLNRPQDFPADAVLSCCVSNFACFLFLGLWKGFLFWDYVSRNLFIKRNLCCFSFLGVRVNFSKESFALCGERPGLLALDLDRFFWAKSGAKKLLLILCHVKLPLEGHLRITALIFTLISGWTAVKLASAWACGFPLQVPHL